MRNIKLIIAFDGTGFSGWQRQTNALTVQGVIEEKLRKMTSEEVALHGAGRTDAGVHALGMPAHFTTETSISAEAFQKGLNSLLPDDIQILSSEDVPLAFHSRINAFCKLYRYYFTTVEICLPTRRLYCAHVPGMKDIEALRKSLSCLEGAHDFSSFEAVGSRDLSQVGGRGATREIFSATVNCLDESHAEWYIDICGDGFLRKMVRNIVGTLFEVGYGRMSIQDFGHVLQAKDRNMAGPTAPACGLFLKKVYYKPSTDYP